MKYLKKHYNIISLKELVDHFEHSKRIPCNSVVITIDDGYKSIYKLAYPVLKEFSFPATIFLATNFVEKNGLEALEKMLKKKLHFCKGAPETYAPLEWREVSEMMESKLISIGSHTCSHAILARCHFEDINKEASISKQIIEEKTGSKCDFFSYPSGTIRDFNNSVKEILKKTGYSCAVTTIPGANDKNTALFELRRMGIDGRYDLLLFVMTITGLIKLFTDIKDLAVNLLKKFKKI